MTVLADKNDEARLSQEKEMLDRILRLRPAQQERIVELLKLHGNATSIEEAAEVREVLADILRDLGDLKATNINDERSADNGKALAEHRNHVAKQIKKQRQSLNMSQEELAGKAGIPQSQCVQAGHLVSTNPLTYKTIEKLAQRWGVPPSTLDPGFDD